MNFLNSLWGFILSIGLLVIVHELGHYLAMRLCGVRVLRFAFGFGKPIWQRIDKKGTEWAICLWPLGGYVKPLDSRESKGLNNQELMEAFDTQTVYKRIFMVAAGPAANFILAIFLFWIVFLNGITEWRPILAAPETGTPAFLAGIHAGDLVVRVDGKTVETWAATQWTVLQTVKNEPSISLAVLQTDAGVPLPGAQDRGVELVYPQDSSISPGLLASLGLKLFTPPMDPIVGQVQPDSAASRSGFVSGDLIKNVNGVQIHDWSEFVRSIRVNPEIELKVEVNRNGKDFVLNLTPARINDQGEVIGRAGLTPMASVNYGNYKTHKSLNVIEAFVVAVNETYEKSLFTLVMLGQMLVGKASLDNLSGPISIAQAAGQTVRIGYEAFLKFLAIVSLSLGVINLLPLPLLDGGHLMYYLTEILTGKPVSAARQALFQRFGVVLLGSLMFIAIFNDLQRLFNW